MSERYPNRETLDMLGRTALNPAYVSADITGDGKKETFCNCFVHTVAVAFGCTLLSQNDGRALAANAQIDVMERSSAFDRTGAAEIAQAEANQGRLVIASRRGRPGHVAVVMPGVTSASPSHGHRLPNGANVGQSNFYGKHLGWAFTHADCPIYFIWKGVQ